MAGYVAPRPRRYTYSLATPCILATQAGDLLNALRSVSQEKLTEVGKQQIFNLVLDNEATPLQLRVCSDVATLGM